jgi:hypothetical protein
MSERNFWGGHNGDDWITVKTSGKLCRTSGEAYAIGIAAYDETNEHPLTYFAASGASLEEVAQKTLNIANFDKDFLASLFAGTEVEDLFVEIIA